MNTFPCLNSSRRALYRVFVTPNRLHDAALQRQMLPLLQLRAAAPAGQTPSLGQTRGYAVKKSGFRPNPREATNQGPPLEFADLGYDPRYTTAQSVEKSGRDRLPRDHEISDPRIMVVTDGVFDGPLLTRTVMSRLDQETQSLRMVKVYVPARPKDNVPVEYAVCRIVNKRDEYQRGRELKKRKQLSSAPKTKEVELNWGIGDHDLQTKMRQLSNFLAKGNKVEVVFGRKKGGKKVEGDAAKDLLVKVKGLVEEANAREWKPSDGEVNRSVRMYVEGKPTPK